MTQQGTIKLFQPEKGFGFITSADGSDIFLHIKNCTDGGVPQKGDVVAFDLAESPVKPGQMQAANVTGGTGVAPEKGKGKGGGGPPGTVQGSCKSYNLEKGFGFVIGGDGADLFFHARGIADGSTPQAGDWLSYDVEESKMKPGQMQATNISGGTGWGEGKGKDGGKGKGDMSQMWGMMDMWGGGGGWGGDAWGKGGGKCDGGWGGGKGDGWGGGKGDGGWGAAKGGWGGGCDWGPYGGGKGDGGWGGGKGDGWGGGKGDGWGGGKGDGGWGGGKGDCWGGGKGDGWSKGKGW